MSHKSFQLVAISVVVLVLALSSMAEKKSKEEKQRDSLDQYMKALATPASTPPVNARGSLFTSSGLLAEPYSDFKAHAVGDTIAVHIVESTTISQSGSVASQRAFNHSSAVTGAGGQTSSFLNPLLAANSNTKLTGTGSTDSKSSLNTVLTAQVVAVLPNGSLVVEARRQVLSNQQHENVVLRGVVRTADIAPNNSVFSYQLSNLQLEVKGKGIISDSVRQPNIVMRTLLRFIGF
ncbi:MAG TPA: flagellar basal body L-ring protein FlgH [Candidatus Saccharimonadales bacterium]|nr:flagellar basal body L-ring protein FlgH [Candidatus Saccharimonadales bacterium]